jgi:hypothetical protein
MGPYFTSIRATAPAIEQLDEFIDGLLRLMYDVVHDSRDEGVWRGRPQFHTLMAASLSELKPQMEQLRSRIRELSDDDLDSHGLRGSNLQLKIHRLSTLETAMRRGAKAITHGMTLRRLLEVAAIVVGSLLQATDLGTAFEELVAIGSTFLPDDA